MTIKLPLPPAALLTIGAALALAACGTTREDTAPVASTPNVPVMGTGNPAVGGVAMEPTRTIVENAALAPNLTTLVAALRAAGLVPTLSGAAPYTVFAPTNDAFGRLAPGIVESLLKPENKTSLGKLLRYHTLAGTITSADLLARIAAGGGSATLTTLEGQPLTATLTGGIVTLTDVNGNKSYVETADVRQANGMVHVVNGVVVPTL